MCDWNGYNRLLIVVGAGVYVQGVLRLTAKLRRQWQYI